MTAVALGPKSLSNSCSRQLRVVNAVVRTRPQTFKERRYVAIFPVFQKIRAKSA